MIEAKPFPVDPDPLRDLMLKTADFLEANHWTRGAYKHGNSYCILGAVYSLTDGSRAAHAIIDDFRDFFYKEVGMNVVNFNDFVAKSKKQVTQKLRELAAKR